MSIRHAPETASLRLLVDVGNMGSVGHAARAAGISQPAASKRLASLERELGLPLVLRSPGGSRLTPEGEVVAEWAQRVLDNVDALLRAATALRTNGDTHLHVAASMTIAEHLLPTWLSTMRSAHPELHVGLRVANSEQVQNLVLEAEAAIGFVEGPSIDRRLASRRIARDRLVVVAAPEHPWAGCSSALPRHELLNTPLVVREAGSGTRATLDLLLQGTDRARPLLELGSNEAVKGAVIAGAGVAVLSILAVEADLATGRLVEIPIQDAVLVRKLSAVWKRGTPPRRSSMWLLDIASAAAKQP
jgi:molybdate transport repressor ModE-like protein